MAVSYKKLFKLMIDRDMKKKKLCQVAHISPATVTKLANEENVTMEVIDKICLGLNCNIEDIVEIIRDEDSESGKSKDLV